MRLLARLPPTPQVVDEARIAQNSPAKRALRCPGPSQIALDLFQKLHCTRLARLLRSCYVPTRKAS